MALDSLMKVDTNKILREERDLLYQDATNREALQTVNEDI